MYDILSVSHTFVQKLVIGTFLMGVGDYLEMDIIMILICNFCPILGGVVVVGVRIDTAI